jgi:drug/metabolite transporter (DMT)-like permease
MLKSQRLNSLRNSTQFTGIAFIFGAMLSLSFAPTLVKVGVSSDAPIPLLSMRLIVGSVALWIYVYLYDARLLRVTPHQLARLFFVGAFNAISLSSFYMAVQYVDASIAVMLFAFNPAFVLLILTVLGETFTRRKQVRLLLAMVGVFLLVGVGGDVALPGVLWGLSVALNYGIFLVASQYLLKGLTARQIAVYAVTSMTLILALVNAVGYGFPLTFTDTGWAVIIVTGLVATALARLFLFAGIQRIGSAQTSLLGPLETLMGVTWAVILLGEQLTLTQFVGGGLVLLSAVLVKRRDTTKTSDFPPLKPLS